MSDTHRANSFTSEDDTSLFDEFDSIVRPMTPGVTPSNNNTVHQPSNAITTTTMFEADNVNDYVDVDEIDDAIQDFNELIEETCDTTLQNELREIYNVLYHAIYDCSNIKVNEDPVPYALLVELQREMERDTANSTTATTATTPTASTSPFHANTVSSDNNRRSMKLDDSMIREQVNKFRKSQSIGSMSPIVQSPSTVTQLHKKQFASVVNHLKRMSLQQLRNEQLHSQQQQQQNQLHVSKIAASAKQLKDVVVTEKKLSQEDEDRLAKDLDLLLRQYIL